MSRLVSMSLFGIIQESIDHEKSASSSQHDHAGAREAK
jgi:hypothetical protein